MVGLSCNMANWNVLTVGIQDWLISLERVQG
jgi:hypothetical protein